MGSWVRSCLQSVLKMVNSVIGLVGMGMIMYSMWMFRSWYKHFDGLPSSFDSSSPWFIYTFLGLGIFHCLITCAGLIAAETVNIHCLSCEDFPEDPTGKFDEFNRFVRSNQEMCKWIGLLIGAAQVLSVILAMVLKVLGPDIETDYDSDDDYIPARLPLLRNQSQTAQPNSTLKNDSWNIKL